MLLIKYVRVTKGGKEMVVISLTVTVMVLVPHVNKEKEMINQDAMTAHHHILETNASLSKYMYI